MGSAGITELAWTVSDPFEVFSPKLFRGMRESTPLTRHLAAQGLKVKLRTDTSLGRHADSRRRVGNGTAANRTSPIAARHSRVDPTSSVDGPYSQYPSGNASYQFSPSPIAVAGYPSRNPVTSSSFPFFSPTFGVGQDPTRPTPGVTAPPQPPIQAAPPQFSERPVPQRFDTKPDPNSSGSRPNHGSSDSLPLPSASAWARDKDQHSTSSPGPRALLSESRGTKRAAGDDGIPVLDHLPRYDWNGEASATASNENC